MIKVEGYKAFHGTMRINYGKSSTIKPFDITADWLYKPEYKCWYGQGRSFPENICEVVEEEPAEIRQMQSEIERLRNELKRYEAEEKGCQYCLDGIDIIQMKFPNTHECGGTWWKESVRTPKYCPMCGRKLPESAEAALSP